MQTFEIVLNRCYGSFDLSVEASHFVKHDADWYADEWTRTDPDLINCIKTLGNYAVDTAFSKLRIIEVPMDCTDWMITEYDGFERVIYVLDGKLHEI